MLPQSQVQNKESKFGSTVFKTIRSTPWHLQNPHVRRVQMSTEQRNVYECLTAALNAYAAVESDTMVCEPESARLEKTVEVDLDTLNQLVFLAFNVVELTQDISPSFISGPANTPSFLKSGWDRSQTDLEGFLHALESLRNYSTALLGSWAAANKQSPEDAVITHSMESSNVCHPHTNANALTFFRHLAAQHLQTMTR